MKLRRSVAKEERAFTRVKAAPRPTRLKQPKVAVAKGYGPLHAENALEGEEFDVRKVLKLQKGGGVFRPGADVGGYYGRKGDAFDSAGRKWGVDPNLLRSISSFETGGWKSQAWRERNNPGGLGGGGRKFESPEAGIEAMARLLRTNYIDKGLTTIPQIARKWAPPGAANDPHGTNPQWAGAVAKIYQGLSGGRYQGGGGGRQFPEAGGRPGAEFQAPSGVGEASAGAGRGSFYVPPPVETPQYNIPANPFGGGDFSFSGGGGGAVGGGTGGGGDTRQSAYDFYGPQQPYGENTGPTGEPLNPDVQFGDYLSQYLANQDPRALIAGNVTGASLEPYYGGTGGISPNYSGIGANPFEGSRNPLDYINPFGKTTQGGSGTGVPTQKAVGIAVGTLSNLLLPGSGFLTGPMARWAMNMLQHGASKGQVRQAVAQAQGKLPPMPRGSVSLPIHGGGAPPVAGGGGYNPFGGLPEGFTETNRFGGGAPIFTPPGFSGPQWTPGGSIFGGTLSRTGWVAGGGSPGNLGGSGTVQAGRYMGRAGMNRPYSAREYANLGGQKYAAPALTGAAGGVTPRPSYQQYTAMWHAPGTVGSSTGPGGAAYAGDLDYQQALPQQSRHIAQRQTFAQGEEDIANFTEKELSEMPVWLRDIMRTMPKYPRATGKGEESDPNPVPVFQGPQGRYYDPDYGLEDKLELAKRGKTKVGVKKGFGPRHAENAVDTIQAVQGDTDTVPAMLTPREAVLNRNAAELAGRDQIEQLNREGNKLAEKGVDLAAGEKTMKPKPRKYQGGVGGVYTQKRAMRPGQVFTGGTPVLGGGTPGWGTKIGVGSGPNPNVYGGGDQRWGTQIGVVSGPDPNVYGRGGRSGGDQRYLGPPVSHEPYRGIPGGIPGVPSGRPTTVFPWQPPKFAVGSENWISGHPAFHSNFFKNPNTGAWQPRAQTMPGMGGGAPPNPGYPPGSFPPAYGGGGGLPNNFGYGDVNAGWAARSQPLQSNSFYPVPQRPLTGQQGVTEVTPIGTPQQGGQAYGPPVALSAPDILSALQKAGKEQGLSSAQIAGLAKAVGSIGGMGGGSGGGAYDQLGGQYANFSISGGGNYQGGISDIGYPPFIAPGAEYHADKGSNWIGPFDENYMIPHYQRGTASVSRFW